MKKKKNLKKLLNLGLIDYTNKTVKMGELDMPYITCKVVPEIDYLATYSQPSTYHKTPMTCVSFFEYDIRFDGLYGLWNAIYYEVKELQEYYLERFSGVTYFIAPDYSKCGDISEAENIHRQFRARIVSIWLAVNLNAFVIPLVSAANLRECRYILDGMDDCRIVAFNAKGPMGDPAQLKIFIEIIRYTVDRLKKLECIIVYSSSPNKEKVISIFKYAVDAGIQICIPDNALLIRNKLKGGQKYGSDIR